MGAKTDDTYTEITTEDTNFLLSQPLKKVEEKLSADFLIRVHRSYLVNLKKISAIEDDLLIIGDQLIPIGKTYRKEVLAHLNFI